MFHEKTPLLNSYPQCSVCVCVSTLFWSKWYHCVQMSIEHGCSLIRSRAFTIVEVLVSIAVIAVLVAIALPTLSRVRSKTIEQVCVVRIRSSSQAVTQYTMDYRGVMPFGGYERHEVDTPYGELATVGGINGLRGGLWATLMADYWEGDLWPEGMKCPDQPEFDPEATPWGDPGFSILSDGIIREPWFWLSSAFHLTPESLSRETKVYEGFVVRPQKIHSVQYPSSKSLLFEYFGFCIPQTPQSLAWMDMAQTQLLPTSSSTVDGSAFRYARRNAYRPAIGMGCDFTLNGVLGRDIDRALENQDAFARLYTSSWGEDDPDP